MKKIIAKLSKLFKQIKIKVKIMDLKSLSTTLSIAFIAVSGIILIGISAINTYINYNSNCKLVENQQHIIADEAVKQVRNYIHKKIDMMSSVVLVSDLTEEDIESQKQIMSRLLNVDNSFRQLALLNNQGDEVSRISRLASSLEGQLTEQNTKELFSNMDTKDFYISSVFIDEMSFEPIILLATPIKDVFGDLKGALISEINLKFMWDVVASMEIGKEGTAYVVDRNGSLIAFRDVSRVIKGENLLNIDLVSKFVNDKNIENTEINSERSKGILGKRSVITYVPLGEPDWAIMVEIPVSEANAPIIKSIWISVFAIFLGFVFAVFAGIFISKRITKPIIKLRDATRVISKGDLDAQINIDCNNEIGELAINFNHMVSNINNIIIDIKKALKVIMEQSLELKRGSTESAEAAKSVVIAMEQISAGTEEQANEAEKTSEQIHNLGNEIDYAVSKAMEVEKITESTKKLSIKSKDTIKLLTRKSKETDRITKEFTEDTKKLNESMEKIQKITDAISVITKKTSLLSLNATIEAAKAGDAGQGFSVIAKEINSLSTQSKESAKMIKPLLKEIKFQTESSINTSKRVHKIVEEQMKAVFSTQDAFDEIITSMDNVIEKIIELNSVISKIEDVKTKTINSVITIRSILEETAASTEEVTAASENQSLIAEQVDEFAQSLYHMGERLVVTTNVFKTKKTN
ncbi:MAG TPA: methyl-accepting chemotaxis protein [Clostridium sp.]|nr:methyl-accepting chemotaxis protein [Clostridium sp.]